MIYVYYMKEMSDFDDRHSEEEMFAIMVDCMGEDFVNTMRGR